MRIPDGAFRRHRRLYGPFDLLHYDFGVDRFKDSLVTMYTTTDPGKTTGDFSTPRAAAAINSVSAYFFPPKDFRDPRELENLGDAVRKDKYPKGPFQLQRGHG
jgi:hypothetical protein